MNRRTPEDMFRSARSLHADAERFSARRAELMSELMSRPIPGPMRAVTATPRLLLSAKPMIAVILIAALLLGGGGAAVAAAQDDLPGDPLYGVKLAAERVQEVVTVDAAAKAQLEARLAERRLSEAEAVIDQDVGTKAGGKAEGRPELSERGYARVEKAFAQFEERVEDIRARIAASGEAEANRIAPGLERALEAHRDALARVRARADGKIDARTRRAEAKEDALIEAVLPHLPEQDRERVRERLQQLLERNPSESGEDEGEAEVESSDSADGSAGAEVNLRDGADINAELPESEPIH